MKKLLRELFSFLAPSPHAAWTRSPAPSWNTGEPALPGRWCCPRRGLAQRHEVREAWGRASTYPCTHLSLPRRSADGQPLATTLVPFETEGRDNANQETGGLLLRSHVRHRRWRVRHWRHHLHHRRRRPHGA